MSLHATQSRRRFDRRTVRRAFTLMEMIVVVTIIALLAGILVPRIWTNVDKAKTSSAKSAVKQIASQVQAYLLDTGARVDDGFDLEVLLLAPENGGGDGGPYLNKQSDLIDPWENAYWIRVPGEVNYDFDIVSNGPDGQPNTTDDMTN